MVRYGKKMRIEILDEVSSTNEYIRRYLKDGENVVVCARRQTGGHGTKGRSFLSEAGGVYMSALTFPENLPAAEAFRVMTHAAVSVCRTAEEFGVFPEIKWPNDVFWRGAKLAGISIENSFSDKRVVSSLVGIGLNAENDLSALGGIAVSLSQASGNPVSADAARDALIRNYCRQDDFKDYLDRVRFLGKTVRVIEGDRTFAATARRILGDGRLEIEEDGTPRILSAAEISLRLGG